MLKNKKLFIIAEAGINHNGNFNTALKLAKKAKEAGADAIKFQTYKTEKRVKKNSPIFDILKKCELNYSEFIKIKDYCDHIGIEFFSTPFDKEAVDFLSSIRVKKYKISSFDISNYELINKILEKKIFTIISTGMASLKEIIKINRIFKYKKVSHCILHCISSYPNKEENSYLANIRFLKNKLNAEIGLSDHTPDINTCEIAYLMGAKVFEKHFKLSKDHKCVDSPVSITPDQLKSLRHKIENINKIIGEPKFGVKNVEKSAKIFKRKKI